MKMQKRIAQALLETGAVKLSPKEPFTWASGIQSPIYCDNRLTMSEPVIRKEIAEGLTELIRKNFPEVEVIAGTATAGIPHAAWVSDLLELPMVYVRSKPKEHGRGNQIEGKISEGDKVVVVEDLISKGGSSITAANALRDAGCEVLGVVSIFTYGLNSATEAFMEADLTYYSLSNFAALMQAAKENGSISETEIEELTEWHSKLKNGEL
ncbi:orotate phosphoribosyltransferase [Chungangia koreensis]|uniref:Orotate phosphoribosyltransferase n=1 Tax=Chungangia koreensis TaxID=752657 RepID=A0ABV8X0J3_9LACT